jgi:hypothetical protein
MQPPLPQSTAHTPSSSPYSPWVSLWWALWDPARLIDPASASGRTDAQPVAVPPRKRSLPNGSRPLRRQISPTGSVFEGVRPYTPGDDYRALDWKAFARTQTPYIRRFEAEQADDWLFWIDATRPMWRLGCSQPLVYAACKWASELGQALQTTAGCQVRVALANGEQAPLPQRMSPQSWPIWLPTAPGVEPTRYTPFSETVASLWQHVPRRTTVVLITHPLQPDLLATCEAIQPRNRMHLWQLDDGLWRDLARPERKGQTLWLGADGCREKQRITLPLAAEQIQAVQLAMTDAENRYRALIPVVQTVDSANLTL